jgi:predicted Zn-dependent protease with MMP-like domain
VVDQTAITDWTEARSPGLSDFEDMATIAFDALPEPFKALCGETVMHVADLPEAEVLSSLGLTSPFDLLGLFEGVGLAQMPAPETGQEPNRIWLYRRPILDYWAEYDETLGAIIAHVLIHEIGHHFGLSDDEMAAIEAGADDQADDRTTQS